MRYVSASLWDYGLMLSDVEWQFSFRSKASSSLLGPASQPEASVSSDGESSIATTLGGAGTKAFKFQNPPITTRKGEQRRKWRRREGKKVKDQWLSRWDHDYDHISQSGHPHSRVRSGMTATASGTLRVTWSWQTLVCMFATCYECSPSRALLRLDVGRTAQASCSLDARIYFCPHTGNSFDLYLHSGFSLYMESHREAWKKQRNLMKQGYNALVRKLPKPPFLFDSTW